MGFDEICESFSESSEVKLCSMYAIVSLRKAHDRSKSPLMSEYSSESVSGSGQGAVANDVELVLRTIVPGEEL